MELTEITDDLTGAADSSSYFTGRGQDVRICLSGNTSLNRKSHQMLSINLSSRNTSPQMAEESHSSLVRKLLTSSKQRFLKKIGTGFRGNDAYELNGCLRAAPDHLVFLIDNAPDLGTFTLYGNQYCEGEILEKSLYAKDPILPPKESFIPSILEKNLDYPIGLVDIDSVKGGNLKKSVADKIQSGCRVIVFDAITKQDTLHIIRTLDPLYPNVFWTGSLGIADGLAEYLFGEWKRENIPTRNIKCLGFCASAYNQSAQQINYSKARGLKVVPIDIDGYIEKPDCSSTIIDTAISNALSLNKDNNVMIIPQVTKYSYKPGTSQKILECFQKIAPIVCSEADFDRLVIIGGETSQTVFQTTATKHLNLAHPLEAAVTQGTICDGYMQGKEFSLKGGSVGSIQALEKMLCRCDIIY